MNLTVSHDAGLAEKNEIFQQVPLLSRLFMFFLLHRPGTWKPESLLVCAARISNNLSTQTLP